MKICLATVHLKPAFTPLSLLYLKAYLVDARGHAFEDVDVVEFDLTAGEDEIARRLVAGGPAIVGLSCYVWNVTTLLAVASRIRALRPATRIVLGGPEVGPVAEDVLGRHPDVDVIVKSEGERPFADLVDAWRDRRDIGGVPGIWFRRGADLVDTADAPIVQDLDGLPSPHEPRYATQVARPNRIICLETQRGCVFQCSFCFYNKDLSIRNRRFSLDRVERELAFWLQQDVGEIYLMDPIFNLNAARAKAICRFIAEHNPRRIGVHAEIWAEFVDAELAGLMRDAHVRFLEVGLQTTDRAALAAVDRRLKVDAFVEGVGHLKTAGLNFELQLIHGLPGDTPGAFRESLNFAASLDPPGISVFSLMVLPGTELWHRARGQGVAFDPDPPYAVRATPTMSAADVAHGRELSAATRHLGESRTLRLLARERGLTFADVLDAWVAWREEHPAPRARPDAADIEAFVRRICEERRIPDEYYRAFALKEFSA